MTRLPVALPVLVATGLLAGCSSFNREWGERIEATARPTPRGPEPLVGCWDGEWRSDVNGHHGRLRMILEPSTGPQDPGVQDPDRGPLRGPSYIARFRATWGDVFNFEYAVPIRVQPIEDGEPERGWKFRGEADLGFFSGGHYEYRGRTDGQTRFLAVYEATNDHGTFRMSRVVGPTGSPPNS